jgi:hypothetical protein
MSSAKPSIIREMRRFTGEFWQETGKEGYDPEQPTTLLRIAKGDLSKMAGASLIERLYGVAKDMWRTTNGNQPRRGSLENWRFTLVQDFDEQLNDRIETQVEKRIAQIAAAGKLLAAREWANQIPVASGLLNKSADKSAHVDLGHQVRADAYEMMELKMLENSGHALSAAMQATRYASLYLFSRLHRKELGYLIRGNRWLDAGYVGVRVLGPADYYSTIPDLRRVLLWLEGWLTEGYMGFIGTHSISGLTMDFRFTAFPPGFRWPCDDSSLASSVLGTQRAAEMLPCTQDICSGDSSSSVDNSNVTKPPIPTIE